MNLAVRNWEPGDRFDRNAHGKPEKIKSLFQEYRVPLWQRRHWPVLVSGEDIVWVRRFGTAAKYRRSAASQRALRFRYTADELEATVAARIESKSRESTSFIVRS
jgi:tRNA(Ile)-lysidine synthetase-like protein